MSERPRARKGGKEGCVHDDSITFEFDDGEMFRGHRVKVSMGPRDRFVSADI